MTKGIKGFQRGNKAGLKTRFTPFRQPERRGRKKSLYQTAKILYGNEFDKKKKKKAVDIIINMSVSDLEQILTKVDNPTSTIPVWVTIIIKALLDDCKRGKTKTLFYLLDFIYGKDNKTLTANISIKKRYEHTLNSKEQETLSSIEKKINVKSVFIEHI